MNVRFKRWIFLLASGLLSVCAGSAFPQSRLPDVHYEPTPQAIVEESLQMAGVNRKDIVYDLGCGDGRFVITAAKKYGARGVGIDIDPVRIRESRRNARAAGVTDRVRFIEADLFKTDIREATVVTLYLLPELNLQLRPILLKDLKPGARVVSHHFDMFDWQPDKTGRMGTKHYYYWVVPTHVAGQWRWSLPWAKGAETFELTLEQSFQDIYGKITTPVQTVSLLEEYLIGNRISFLLRYRPSGKTVDMRFQGRVTGDTIRGTVDVLSGLFAGRHPWTARKTHTLPPRP
jgi:SAM-dependent methyltransferase